MNLLFIILNIYFVSFTNKAGSTEPALSPVALTMREERGLPLDSLDYPVSAEYLSQVRDLGAQIHHTSRWFNGATVETEDSAVVQAIRALPFVTSATMTRDHTKGYAISPRKRTMQPSAATAYTNNDQLALYNLLPLHNLGFQGQGIRLAICDGAFYNANNISWVDSEHFLGHYDFTDDAEDFFGTSGGHGTFVLSFIAGNTAHYHGAAVHAQYYLMRSEENKPESPKEIDNLVAAIEAADSLGVHIFSASLGYSEFDNPQWDLTYSQMDGQSTRASRAATIASRKGMLVCIAAGNEGYKPWRYITVPADADSILTVGAVTYDKSVAAFSSRGPSADGRVKPDVCALGQSAWYIAEDGITMVQGNGTSFACPLLAGLAATLWSAMPQLTNTELRELIIQSASHYSTPDGNFGYGIPDAFRAYQLATGIPQTQSVTRPAHKILRDGTIIIIVDGKEYNTLGIRQE